MLDHNVSSIRAAEELELHFRELGTQINRYLLSGDETHITTGLSMKEEIERWTKEARRCATTEVEVALMEVINRDIELLFAELSDFNRRSLDATSRSALQETTRNLLTNQIFVNARKYLDVNEKDLERSQADVHKMAGRVVLALLLLGSSGSIAGLMAGYGLARGLTRELVHLSFTIRDVAGKLNKVVGPISVSTKPTIQDLQSILITVSEEVGTIVNQLQRTHREMMRADQLAATGQLAAGLAHELRNPLMSIKLIIQAARRSAESLGERDLHVLEEEVIRLESLLQTFLDFAKPAKMESTRFDLKRIVAASLQFLSRRAALKRVTFESFIDEQIFVVNGDESQLRQVLLNLLLNALDAVPPGGQIQVQLEPASPTCEVENCVVLRVSDNGPGLSEIDRIFEPFYSTRETGLGLGLPISKRIIDAHGGDITAGNGSLGGAEFIVRLPLADMSETVSNGLPHHVCSTG